MQILLLPAPFSAFIPSPQILAGQTTSRSKTENAEETFALEGAEDAHCQSLLHSRAGIRGIMHLVWADNTHVSLLLRSTSKERLVGFPHACKT